MSTTRAARRATTVRAARRSRLARAVAVAVSAVLVAVVSVAVAQAEAPVPVLEFVVDNAGNSGDTNTGDLECRASGGGCTLRAALQQSNAIDVELGEVRITVAEGKRFTLVPTMVTNETNYMRASAVTAGDAGALFEITRPVTVDLDDRFSVAPRSWGSPATWGPDSVRGAAFYVDAPDVRLLNFTDVFGSGTSIVMGSDAERVLVQGGSSDTGTRTGSNRPARFMTFREGASDITVRDHALRGFGTSTGALPGSGTDASTPRSEALFMFNAQDATPIQNIVVDGVDIALGTGDSCGPDHSSGCGADLTAFDPYVGVVLDGFTFTSSTVTDLGAFDGFRFGDGNGAEPGIALSGLNISDNAFLGVTGAQEGPASAFVVLPDRALSGANQIVRNTFTHTESVTGQSTAISWRGGLTDGGSTAASDLVIADNHFDGWGHGTQTPLRETVRVQDAGSVTVARNTFGARTQSAETPNSPEGAMVSVLDANGRIATWYPTGAATAGSTPFGSALTVSGGRVPEAMPQCWATVQVRRPSGDDGPSGSARTNSAQPGSPVTLDLYWTGTSAADLYLGSVSGIDGEEATLEFPVPVGPVGVVSSTGGTTVAPVVDGALTGSVRVQTHVESTPQVSSSQLSALVDLEGTCDPALTLDRAPGQESPTMVRDLHVTLASSQPLDVTTLDASDLTVTVVGTGSTTDVGVLNPRVSITPVAGSSGRVFDVVLRVDDSATVTVTGPGSGAVTSTAGLPNDEAASGEGVVDFVNPLVVTSDRLLVVTGDEAGQGYRVALQNDAPEPGAALVLTAVSGAVEGAPALSVSPGVPVIALGESASEEIRVSAAAGDVVAGTPVPVDHTVRSDDLAYDGLIVPSVVARLFVTDPAVSITKSAYLDVADDSTPESVRSTGTYVATGGRLAVGQIACFVYEVVNVSDGDWETDLREGVVTDTDTRLGTGGVIGHFADLQPGDSTELHACARLAPVDTATGGLAP